MKLKINVLPIIAFTLLAGCSWLPKTFTYPVQANTPTSLPALPIPITPSRNPTVAIGATALPPLLPDNAKDVLSLFVRNNGGCELPCLMGLTPGESNESIEAFGNYFVKNTQQSSDQMDNVEIIGHMDDDSGGALLAFWDNHIRVQIGVGARLTTDKEQIDHVTLSASVYEHFEDSNGIPVARLLQVHPYFDNLLKRFSLLSTLVEYGVPTEIWIYPFPEDLGYSYNSSTYPFVFVLIYKDVGFAIEYIGIVKDDGEYLTGCPNVDNIKISTWSPQTKQAITISDVSQYFSGLEGLSPSNASFFKPLQTATSHTIKDFSDTYKSTNKEKHCIQTPRHLWP
jgi:hypothetical protein